ncbi:putative zn-finger domain-containing protein [Lyophyllum shimeji]|uniref:Zn-finger domain-containing protein n=1 Tax=Lyophyllum shimeji TaxID=47721 RepID=A0A9P3UTS5_LYOSH|nr:putative zn-finger domain-containing protein [Lyophyllum shimeji]
MDDSHGLSHVIVDTGDDDEPVVVATAIPPSTSAFTPSEGFDNYNIALHHPPALRDIPASVITEVHGASRFLPAVQAFLAQHGSRITAHPFDGFDLFKRISIMLPDIPQANANDRKNIVRATPPVPARGRARAEPAHLDFALVRTGEHNVRTDGTALDGLRVAHVRVIFKLPSVYRIRTMHPLVYVEWYTPFSKPDPVSGLFTLKPSTRNRHIYGEIIEVDRIVRNIHMMPKYGRTKDVTWSRENIVEHCKAFYPSPYSDTHMFCLLRVGMKSAVPR